MTATARRALRQRRKQLDASQEQVALAVGVSTTAYRSWEAGTSTPRVGRRRRLAEALGVSLAEIDRLLYGHDQSPISSHVVPDWLGHYASLEQGAARIQTFEPIVVPGLLQTRDYAAVVESVGPDPATSDEVARRVETRIARQGVLDRRAEPLELFALIDEGVLRRVTGGPDVMADQLGHLAAMAESPNVELQVLPLDGRVHCAAFGAFQLLTSPGASTPYVACAEDMTGVRYHESPPAVEAHALLFQHLTSVALSPADSIDLIRRTAKEHYR